MTAQVVIMNTNGVAMAADSAGTIGLGVGNKQTYNTANKLFQISHEHSVGIMLYNNSSLHSVPWETIIKTYRESFENGFVGFATLEEYAEDFIKFLKKHSKDLTPLFYQQKELGEFCKFTLHDLDNFISSKWQSSGNKNSSKEDYLTYALTEFSNAHKADLKLFTENHRKKIFNLVKNSVEYFMKEFSQYSKFIKFAKGKIYNLLCEVVFKDAIQFIVNSGYTGIVFAGLGKRELFSSSYSFEVFSYHLDKLRIENRSLQKIKHDRRAIIIPYAQRDMVDTFMRGIHPVHDIMVKKSLSDIVEPMSESIIDKILSEINELSDVQKKQVKSRVVSQMPNGSDINLMEKMLAYLEDYFANYSRNIAQGISHLSKDQIADVAGSMLRLATLQKQVSLGDDSVGGPIDVAVISKGDGFVWINRKHYFAKDLNPQYFKRFQGKK